MQFWFEKLAAKPQRHAFPFTGLIRWTVIEVWECGITPAALDNLCELLFSRGQIKDVIVVVLPGERSAIHLDMIFTQVDRDLCVVYPPHFAGPERLAVVWQDRQWTYAGSTPDRAWHR